MCVCNAAPPTTRPSRIFPARVLWRRRPRRDCLIFYCCRVIDRRRCAQVVRRVRFFQFLLSICVVFLCVYNNIFLLTAVYYATKATRDQRASLPLSTAVLILCFWSAARENWSVILSQTRCDVGVGGRREENVFYNTFLRTTILQWPHTERVIRSLEYNNIIYFFFQRNSVINILTCRTCFAQRRQRTNNLTINRGFSLKLKHIIIIILLYVCSFYSYYKICTVIVCYRCLSPSWA